ncbi:beta-xylosidase [Polyplosphaeria fusca]|uniref:xylan 1,4-beta-xylosidase n=1 Tax=Polyplosphaeria fusca TaxID=682080 RepID=A0A9P4R6V4_9PLEO|nr:beta-xylosidase [Polyplosphaeria fusca]
MALAMGPDCSSGPLKSNKICDTTADPAARAAALVAAMQQQEKLDNLVRSKGVSRLGLPAYNWWGEALHGVADAPGIQFSAPFKSATSFPMPILMSAAFDDQLIYDVATIIGTEARAFSNGGMAPVDFWTPNINPYKDPRWGRGSETPGEDALRLKGYVKSLLSGLEGNATQRRIIATCKHYAGNDLEDWKGTNRHNFDAKITQQDLAEYYLQPFQQCARDSKVGSFMCSYNSVNGVPACANTFLMGTILRDHWKWTEDNNYITSDCEAVLDISANHHYSSSNAAGTAIAFNSGMDTSCEYSGSSDIPGAWKSGALNETTVNKALNRLYHGLVRAGYFDGASAVYSKLGISDVNTQKAQQLARQAAADGIVMLKNDKTLPLALRKGSKVALVGFWAEKSDELQGGYSGNAPFLHSPSYAAQQLGLTVKTATGPVLQSNSASDTWTTKALAAAKDSDYILYFGGQNKDAAMEGKDRLTLNWPEAQATLIKKLADLGKPLVIVQMGDMLDNTPLLSIKGVNAILWASWPGQDGGPAVLDIITGAKAVAGRLPVTQYPTNYTNLAMTDMNLRPGGSNPGRTYRWYPSAVQTFGFGLHYTTFKASFDGSTTSYNIQDLLKSCSNEFPDTCALPSLPVSIANTGNVTSDFVALAFIAGQNGPKPYPIKTLAAYKRVRDVAPGKSVKTSLEWTLANVARHDEKGNTVLYPGSYQILLDEPTQTMLNFTLTGDQAVLDKWPTPPS